MSGVEIGCWILGVVAAWTVVLAFTLAVMRGSHRGGRR